MADLECKILFFDLCRQLSNLRAQLLDQRDHRLWALVVDSSDLFTGRQVRPEDIGKIDPSLLEYAPFSEDPAATAATFGPLPTILAEPALAVLVLEGRTNTVL
jgi:hypothetical protein